MAAHLLAREVAEHIVAKWGRTGLIVTRPLHRHGIEEYPLLIYKDGCHVDTIPTESLSSANRIMARLENPAVRS